MKEARVKRNSPFFSVSVLNDTADTSAVKLVNPEINQA